MTEEQHTKSMQVPYQKMHGTGNLILIVDQRADNFPPPGGDALRRLGNEKTGPGFDQLMWIGPSDDDAAVASYRVFNNDGSEVEQCGNGVRCVARFLAGETGSDPEFTLQSPAGPIEARIEGDGRVSVSMGAPVFEPMKIPFEAEMAADRYFVDVGDLVLEVSALSMGNPHCVLQVEDVANAPVSDWGPQLEHHRRFPQLTNVGFMQVEDSNNIVLRVHERGVGETAACGTGACAAVVAGQRLGLLDDDVHVQLPGGQVMVSWRRGNHPVWLTGDAEWINDGTMDLDE